MDEDTFEYIYDVSDKVTWYVQAILHGILRAFQGIWMDRQLVDDVVREIIESQSTAYQNYCAWLTENQQRLLTAIARERLVTSPLGQIFIRSYNLPAVSSVKAALKSLVDKQLISKKHPKVTMSVRPLLRQVALRTCFLIERFLILKESS